MKYMHAINTSTSYILKTQVHKFSIYQEQDHSDKRSNEGTPSKAKHLRVNNLKDGWNRKSLRKNYHLQQHPYGDQKELRVALKLGTLQNFHQDFPIQ